MLSTAISAAESRMLKAGCWFGLACSACDVAVLRADQSKGCRAELSSFLSPMLRVHGAL